jgi:hypothetical protein
MKNYIHKKSISIILVLIFIFSSFGYAFGIPIHKEFNNEGSSDINIKHIEIELSFSYPEVVKHGNYWVVRVNETNHNQYVLFDLDPGKPVLPVNISIFKLIFGSKIIDMTYEHSPAQIMDLPGILSFCKASYDSAIYSEKEIEMDLTIYENDELYPSDWVISQTGGGLSQAEHTTFLTVRVYPVRYLPLDNQLHFIENITVNISYIEPSYPILGESDIYDLLIISPSRFTRALKKLVNHKNSHEVRTKLVTLNFIYDRIWYGRDEAEKIKFFIKEAIEKTGVKYVLLVGGLKYQRLKWHLPVRYSQVVPFDEQEYPEQSFLSDLYYADIYDGEGQFSSWDSNGDNIFSVWNDTFQEEMDLYPDVYLGRLPCRNIKEVRIMTKKIIKYEQSNHKEEDWFNKIILVAGDSYNDTNHYNEGELISEKAIELMPGFDPVRIYARENESRDIDRKTVNSAMNDGASFAYFCGHGSPGTWSTHFPPDGVNWTSRYDLLGMFFLRNRGRLPITVVGGCHNGQFDVTLLNLLLDYSYAYRHITWVPRCWGWYLTVKKGGGAIATISNTGLGTHGDGDMDNNTIPDYLEILDGWLELRFLEFYGMENKDVLGQNHGDTLTGYLNKFLGDNAKMDVKMVQQWQLFGDPSLKIGGYEEIPQN